MMPFFQRNLRNTSTSAYSEAELKNMPLSDLEEITSRDTAKYIELLTQKTDLERTIDDKSIDAKTKCEAYSKLLPMLDSFHQFEATHARNLKILETRLIDSLTEEQKSSFNPMMPR